MVRQLQAGASAVLGLNARRVLDDGYDDVWQGRWELEAAVQARVAAL